MPKGTGGGLTTNDRSTLSNQRDMFKSMNQNEEKKKVMKYSLKLEKETKE